MFLIIILLCVVITIYITNPFITIFHELGHAIAYLILTKPDKIDIFIGSNESSNSKINFKIGKLHFHIKLSFLLNGGGMCKSNKVEANYMNQIIIFLAGPFFSLIIVCTIGFIAFNSEIYGIVKLFFCASIIFSIISLYSNLKPYTNINTGLDNDGKQLLFILKYRKVFTDYISACVLFNNGEFNLCSEKLIKIASIYPYEKKFLRPLTDSLLQTKNFTQAEKYLIDLQQTREFEVQDYLNLGYLQSLSNRTELAISNYRQALDIEKDNLIGLNNLGYELTLKGEYEEGQELLERAIRINPEFAHPYSNLGCLKILSGDLDAGKELVEKSLDLEPDNAYAYKHLGIYYLKSGDKEKSLTNFQKALELDATIDLMPFYKDAELP